MTFVKLKINYRLKNCANPQIKIIIRAMSCDEDMLWNSRKWDRNVRSECEEDNWHRL
jgi:hypothetical protein